MEQIKKRCRTLGVCAVFASNHFRPKKYRAVHRTRQVSGFTLMELLVVISIIALLMSILMPSLGRARMLAKSVVCSSQMRSYGIAVVLYSAQNDSAFPPYATGRAYTDPAYPHETWINLLAPYLGGKDIAMDDAVGNDYNMNAEFRRCPAARRENGILRGWIGCIYGGGSNWGSSAPFVIVGPGYGPVKKITNIRQPSALGAFMDTLDGWGMYSRSGWEFDADLDSDGKDDSNGSCGYGYIKYNWALPKVHLDNSSVVYCDGHVGKMRFDEFLDPGNPVWGKR